MKISRKEYEMLRHLVYENSRINLGDEKYELVSARVAKRLRALHMHHYEEYCAFLASSAGHQELEHLINAISTNYSYFFREPNHLDFLVSHILPDLNTRSTFSPSQPMRIWSAACATGEEPYTLAMMLCEHFGTNKMREWKILATDISSGALETARRGIYAQEKMKMPDPSWVHTYFQYGVGDYQGYFRIKSPIRKQIQFERYNLLQATDAFADMQFEIIFCRNVMIYFDRATQQELIHKLEQKLRPNGYLITGCSESLNGVSHGMKSFGSSIYKKQMALT